MYRAKRRRRHSLSGPAAALLLAACSRPSEPPPPAPEPAPVATPPAPPQPPSVLDRAVLLQAVGRAASAHAAGGAYPEAVAALGGRRFLLRLPFGCDGPSPEDAPEGYLRDGEAMTIWAERVRWSDPAWLSAFADAEEVERLEGFWIRRPWLATAACPAKGAAQPIVAAQAGKPGVAPKPMVAPKPGVRATPGGPATPETVGLVRIFKVDDSRLRQRGERPYRITLKSDPDAAAPRGLTLVLEGRVAEAAGRPIRCRSASPDQRPVCLVSVEFERVSFEDAQGEVLAEWRE